MQMGPRRKGEPGPGLEVILTSGKGGAPWRGFPARTSRPAERVSTRRGQHHVCWEPRPAPAIVTTRQCPACLMWSRSVHTGHRTLTGSISEWGGSGVEADDGL